MTNKSFLSIREMTLCAIFVALLAIGGQIALNFTGVPFTLQTLVVMLAGSLLGKRLGTISMFVFIGLVAVGAPILSGFKGGIAPLFGPTAGYIWSFPIATFLVGLFIEKFSNNEKPKYWHILIAYIMGSIIIVHTMGFIWYCNYAGLSLQSQLVPVLLVFLPWDLSKAVVATAISLSVYAAMPSLLTSFRKEKQKSVSA